MLRPIFVRLSLIAAFTLGLWSNALADLPDTYWIEAEITTHSGEKLHSYFFLPDEITVIIEKRQFHSMSLNRWESLPLTGNADRTSVTLGPDQTDFSNYVIGRLQNGIQLFADVAHVTMSAENGFRYGTIKSLKPGRHLAPEEIKSLRVIRLLLQSAGCEVTTPLTASDTRWINGQPAVWQDFVGGFGMCDYKVVLYRPFSNEVEKLIEEIRQLLDEGVKTYDQPAQSNPNAPDLETRLQSLAERLREHRAVIVAYCSC